MSKKKVKGNEGMLYLYDATAEAYKPVVCATSNGINSSREQNEDEPTKCDPLVTGFTPGRIDTTLDFAGQSNIIDGGASVSYFEIEQAQKDGIVDWKYVYNLDSDVADRQERFFRGLVTDLGKEQNVNETATFNFSIRVEGKVKNEDPFAIV